METEVSKNKVSVIVFTYNSSSYLVQTLDSIKSQTYKNIELIISDDGSSDDTLAISKDWVSKNGERFCRTKILSVSKNTGVSANCIRGTTEANGEWIKLLAGDDILEEKCIETFLEISLAKKSAVLISNLQCFTSTAQYDYVNLDISENNFFSLSLDEKLEYYIMNPFFLNVPSIFFNRSILEIPNLFNPKYRLLEDQPMFYKILQSKIDIHFADVKLVNYRIHDSSITGKINPAFQKALYDCYKEFRKPYIANNMKGILFKRLTELAFYVNINFSNFSFRDRAIRKIHNTFKNSFKPFIKY